MQAMTTIGLDIAKSVFQVHGVDAEGNVLIRRQLKRLRERNELVKRLTQYSLSGIDKTDRSGT